MKFYEWKPLQYLEICFHVDQEWGENCEIKAKKCEFKKIINLSKNQKFKIYKGNIYLLLLCLKNKDLLRHKKFIFLLLLCLARSSLTKWTSIRSSKMKCRYDNILIISKWTKYSSFWFHIFNSRSLFSLHRQRLWAHWIMTKTWTIRERDSFDSLYFDEIAWYNKDNATFSIEGFFMRILYMQINPEPFIISSRHLQP